MKEKKPSIVKALNETLVLSLKADGFETLKKNYFGRVTEDFFQYVKISVRTNSRREFLIEYASIFLSMPLEFIPLEPGGQFEGSWFWAENERILENSIKKVNELYIREYRGWFQDASELKSFLRILKTYGKKKQRVNSGHLDPIMGGCFLRMGEVKKAVLHIKRAKELFDGFHAQNPRGTWAEVYSRHSDCLLKAINEGDGIEPLDSWRSKTLKLISNK